MKTIIHVVLAIGIYLFCEYLFRLSAKHKRPWTHWLVLLLMITGMLFLVKAGNASFIYQGF